MALASKATYRHSARFCTDTILMTSGQLGRTELKLQGDRGGCELPDNAAAGGSPRDRRTAPLISPAYSFITSANRGLVEVISIFNENSRAFLPRCLAVENGGGNDLGRAPVLVPPCSLPLSQANNGLAFFLSNFPASVNRANMAAYRGGRPAPLLISRPCSCYCERRQDLFVTR